MISRGTLNHKGRPIFDIEQEPEEAMLVQMIFRLYAKENYGAKKIARLMNDTGKKTHKGGKWSSSTVMTILRNKIYIGFYELGKWSQIRLVSPRMEKLQIIDDQLFYETQEAIKKNTTGLTTAKRQRPTRHGSMLLTGLLYCGDCGMKYTSQVHRVEKPRANGTTWHYERLTYRCRSYHVPQAGHESCERRLVHAQRLDALIVYDVKNFMGELNREKLLTSFEEQMQGQEHDFEDCIRKTASEKAQRERELQKLKEEVIRALMGTSQFNQELLNEMITAKTAEVQDLWQKHEEARLALEEFKKNMSQRRAMAEELTGWEERFDAQDTMNKKAMLISLIQRITIFGDKVEVLYNVKLDVLGDNGEEFDSEQSGEYNNEECTINGGEQSKVAGEALFSTGLVKGLATPRFTVPKFNSASKPIRLTHLDRL